MNGSTALGFHESMARHSRSFSLAARLLPRNGRDDVAVLYAWCRACDDAVDLAPVPQRAAALQTLFAELDLVHSDAVPQTPMLRALQGVVRRHQIPRVYMEELLRGMQMDVDGVVYNSLEELWVYCFRVAGTVGLMMCHVLGVSRPEALRHAAHLGMAMQLTNICRDVREDWENHRLYIPQALLPAAAVGWRSSLGGEIPLPARSHLAGAVDQLLQHASRFYASADRGLPMLRWRTAMAVAAARHIYAGIGGMLARRQFDVVAPRAVVPTSQKMWMMARACAASLRYALRRFVPVRLTAPARFPNDILPL